MNKTLKYLKTRFRGLTGCNGDSRDDGDKSTVHKSNGYMVNKLNKDQGKVVLSALSSSATLTEGVIMERGNDIDDNNNSSEQLLKIWENQKSGYILKERDSLHYGDIMIYCVWTPYIWANTRIAKKKVTISKEWLLVKSDY